MTTPKIDLPCQPYRVKALGAYKPYFHKAMVLVEIQNKNATLVKTRKRHGKLQTLHNLALAIQIPSPFIMLKSRAMLGLRQPHPVSYIGPNGTAVGWSEIVLAPYKSGIFQFVFGLGTRDACRSRHRISFTVITFQYADGEDPWLSSTARVCPQRINVPVKVRLTCRGRKYWDRRTSIMEEEE